VDKSEACGIEVSARELVVAMTEKNGGIRLQRFANTAAGHRAMLRTLTRGGRRVRAVMEATGLYGLDLALYLSGKENIELMVANPRAVRNFAQAMMQRSKNDPLDAVLLCEFARRMEFRAWTVPSENTLALWAMARRLEALTKQVTAEKNRRHAASLSRAVPPTVRRSILRSQRFLEREMQQLRREARRIIAGDAALRQRYQQLRSVPGIAENSALQILAELEMLPQDRDVRQWVAYAGLDPREYRSGTSVRQRPRISKVGNRHLRHALYMPALVASRHEPHLRGFYKHLQERGKSKRQALVAVARKLLHASYGMFRSGQGYDGARVFALPTSPAQIKCA